MSRLPAISVLTASHATVAFIVSVFNAKGGTGNTTLATNLARALQLDGNDVLLIDTDPQGTAMMWHGRQPDGYDLPACHAPSATALREAITRHSGGAEAIVVDGSAKMDGTTGAAVAPAAAVLIPVQPTPADTWGASSAVQAVQKTGSRGALVISRQIVGTKLATEMAEGVEAYGLPVFDHRTSQRVAYAEAMSSGKTVLDLPRAEKAQAEIRGIVSELGQFLNGQGAP